MVTLREKGLVIANKLRQLPTKFDIRLYTVTVRVITWSGSDVPGQGTPITVDTPIYLDGYGTLPKVTVLSTKDIVASNGLYKDGDYKINFITPFYTVLGGGGVPINIFEPPEGTSPTEILYLITGPEFTNGALFKKIETYTYRPFHYSFVVRKIGVP